MDLNEALYRQYLRCGLSEPEYAQPRLENELERQGPDYVRRYIEDDFPDLDSSEPGWIHTQPVARGTHPGERCWLPPMMLGLAGLRSPKAPHQTHDLERAKATL
jgi:hypothetical protein